MNNTDIDSALNNLGLSKIFTKRTHNDVTIWEFSISETPSFIQTQSSANRMRIVAKIGNPKYNERSDLTSLMEANYHTTLDCRYAIVDGLLVATFIHPLSELTREQFTSGLSQVISSTLSCGRENSAGTLNFGNASGKAYHDRNQSSKEELFSHLTNLDLQGANLNVTVYQGNVEHANLEQNRYGSASQPSESSRNLDWWRHVVVPLLVAIIGAMSLVIVAILKGWIG